MQIDTAYLRLDEVKVLKRVNNATVGPWFREYSRKVFGILRQVWIDDLPFDSDEIGTADLHFIAHARTDTPELLQRLAEARRTLADAKHLASRIRLTCSCVNWMGGCKREYHCGYGALMELREKLDAAAQAKETE